MEKSLSSITATGKRLGEFIFWNFLLMLTFSRQRGGNLNIRRFADIPAHIDGIADPKISTWENIMTKAELVKALKEKAALATNAQAEAAHDALIGILADSLKKGDAVTLTGFGSFKIVHRAARKGRNPRTGKELQIPASKAVKFTPSKTLKDGI
jgi:DNA-binding protein HU-beta